MKSAPPPPRRNQVDIARAIKSRDKARKTGIYHDSVEILAELRGMLDRAMDSHRRAK